MKAKKHEHWASIYAILSISERTCSILPASVLEELFDVLDLLGLQCNSHGTCRSKSANGGACISAACVYTHHDGYKECRGCGTGVNERCHDTLLRSLPSSSALPAGCSASVIGLLFSRLQSEPSLEFRPALGWAGNFGGEIDLNYFEFLENPVKFLPPAHFDHAGQIQLREAGKCKARHTRWESSPSTTVTLPQPAHHE